MDLSPVSEYCARDLELSNHYAVLLVFAQILELKPLTGISEIQQFVPDPIFNYFYRRDRDEATCSSVSA